MNSHQNPASAHRQGNPKLRDHCPRGDRFETDSWREFNRWQRAHAHHHTARAHYRSRQRQHGLPTKPFRGRVLTG